MDEKIIQIAITALDIEREDAIRNCKELPKINAFYFWNKSRGGKAVIISKNGEKFVVSSVVSLDQHIQAYRSGRRN